MLQNIDVETNVNALSGNPSDNHKRITKRKIQKTKLKKEFGDSKVKSKVKKSKLSHIKCVTTGGPPETQEGGNNTGSGNNSTNTGGNTRRQQNNTTGSSTRGISYDEFINHN
jgi:hypothetical protein